MKCLGSPQSFRNINKKFRSVKKDEIGNFDQMDKHLLQVYPQTVLRNRDNDPEILTEQK